MIKKIINGPSWASKPGDTIKDILEEKNITLNDFALAMNLSIKECRGLISGKQPINQQIAWDLSQVLGSTPVFWIDREEQFVQALRNNFYHKESIIGKKFIYKSEITAHLTHGVIGRESVNVQFYDADFKNFDPYKVMFSKSNTQVVAYKKTIPLIISTQGITYRVDEILIESDFKPTNPFGNLRLPTKPENDGTKE